MEDYENYIMNDINNIRRRFGIPERELNEIFSLFSAEDFQTEYRMVIRAAVKSLQRLSLM